MTVSVIDVPESIAEHHIDFIEFVGMMTDKLNLNSHKSTPTTDDIPAMVEKMMGEMAEFVRQYMEDPTHPNVYLELADVSNFAFLIYVVLQRKNDAIPT